MGLHKGQCNNRTGRKPGKTNKITSDLRTRLKTFLDDNFDEVTNSFKDLQPRDKILMYEKLLSFTLPKMKETDLRLNLETLTDEQIDLIISKIINDEKD